MAVDGAGNAYVTDTIRKLTPAGTTTMVAGIAGLAGIVLGATLPVGISHNPPTAS